MLTSSHQEAREENAKTRLRAHDDDDINTVNSLGLSDAALVCACFCDRTCTSWHISLRIDLTAMTQIEKELQAIKACRNERVAAFLLALRQQRITYFNNLAPEFVRK